MTLRQSMLILLLFAPFFTSCDTGGTHPHVEALVGSTRIKCPLPNGFISAAENAPLLHRYGSNATPPTNRLVALFVSTQDGDTSQTTRNPEFTRYFAIQTLRKAENQQITSANFTEAKQYIAKNHQRLSKDVLPAAQSQVSASSGALSQALGLQSLSINLGDSRSLGIFEERENSISRFVVMSVQTKANEEKSEGLVIYSSTTALVKNKLVYFYAYSPYTGDADIEWVRANTLDWLNRLAAIN